MSLSNLRARLTIVYVIASSITVAAESPQTSAIRFTGNEVLSILGYSPVFKTELTWKAPVQVISATVVRGRRLSTGELKEEKVGPALSAFGFDSDTKSLKCSVGCAFSKDEKTFSLFVDGWWNTYNALLPLALHELNAIHESGVFLDGVVVCAYSSKAHPPKKLADCDGYFGIRLETR